MAPHAADPDTTTTRSERGASLVEYALLLALIVLVAIMSVRFFGSSVSTNISRSASSVEVTP